MWGSIWLHRVEGQVQVDCAENAGKCALIMAYGLQQAGTTSEEGVGASELGDVEAASSPKVTGLPIYWSHTRFGSRHMHGRWWSTERHMISSIGSIKMANLKCCAV